MSQPVSCSTCSDGDGRRKIDYGNGIAICELCLLDGSAVLSHRSKEEVFPDVADTLKSSEPMEKVKLQVSNLKKPSEIFDEMSCTIIGQDQARKAVATAVYQHQKRILMSDLGLGENIRKSNLLLIGQTGTGKTLLAETVAKICDIPMAIVDSTPLTEAGYIGDSVEDILVSLLEKCHWDVEKAEKGIVFLDEIDKISKRGDSAQLNRDPGGDGVQNALLKMVEGTDVRVPDGGGRKIGKGNHLTVNTSNILFIVSGAFSGIESLVEESSESSDTIGFIRNHTSSLSEVESNQNIMSQVKTDHLIKFGMKPEFVGRFSTIVPLESLTEAIMARIIIEPKGSYWGSQKLLAQADGVDLDITDDAVSTIAKYALEQKIGARAIDGVLNNILKEFNFISPSCWDDSLLITKEMVEEYL